MDQERGAASVLHALHQARLGKKPLAGWPLDDLAVAPGFQLVALAIFGEGERELLGWIGETRPGALRTARAAIEEGAAPGSWGRLCRAVRTRSPLRRADLVEVALGLIDDSIDREWLAAWLALCVKHGLPADSVASLTYALRDSGSVVDLRDDLRPARLARRYPTGSVSEKVAMILPPLVSLVRDRGLATPVIVAKSLGFAGGTWDKLSRIPGFRFLDSSATKGALERVGACYTVPNESIAPADRELYSFRAATGTVDSVPLIAASIASKHLAMPVDALLLDVQVGAAGFVPDEDAANELTALVAKLAAPARMRVASHLRSAETPTGSCVGPCVEVWEALAVLGATGPPFASLDPRPVERQREVGARVFGALLELAGVGDVAELEASALDCMGSGAALDALRGILEEHSVSARTVTELLSDPLAVLGCGNRATVVRAAQAGQVSSIDGRALGLAVNIGLNAGDNRFLAEGPSAVGVQLHVQPGDRFQPGDALYTVHGAEPGNSLETCIKLAG